MNLISEVLRENNLKATPQRLAIYQMLCNTKAHPSAETIYTVIRPNFPSMSLATVYKTLDSLADARLIQELNVGENSFRYDAIVNPHPHFICMKCNEVSDLPSSDHIHQLKEEYADTTDFEISHEQLYFYGCCGCCKESAL